MMKPLQSLTRETFRRQPLREAEACTLVIFGAPGDLTRRKLFPALYDLQCLGNMGSRCETIGTGRTRFTDEQFRDRVSEAFAESNDAVDIKGPRWQGFERRLHNVAAKVACVIAGREKATMLQRVLEEPYDPDALPARAMALPDGQALWLVDAEAADLSEMSRQ